MDNDRAARLEAEKNAAEAEVTRLRKEQSALKQIAREQGEKTWAADLRKLSALIAEAKTRLERAEAEIRAFRKTGKEHSLITENNTVVGTIAVLLPAGTSHEAREERIEEALNDALNEAADELGVVLAAAPMRYTRERPGRDAEGRTVLDVAGRVEGDRLVPAVSRASQNLRS